MNSCNEQLPKHSAQPVALSPVGFVARSAEVFGDLPAVVRGSRVSVMPPDTPERVGARHAVPALGAALDTLNTRLDAARRAWPMNHGEALALNCGREFAPQVASALALQTSTNRSPR